MTASSIFSLSPGSTALTFIVLLAFQPTAQGDDWAEPLEQALALDNDGYTFLAIERLENLRHNHAQALRVTLELAVLHLKAGQPDDAARYIDEVLRSPDLPIKVRINAQMLQLKIQEAQNAPKQHIRTTLSLSSGYEADDGTAFVQLQGGSRLSRHLPTLNMNGRPLPAQLVINAAGVIDREFATGQQPWLVKLDGGVSLAATSVKLDAGAGYQASSAIDGPYLFVAGHWQNKLWRLGLVSQWLYPGDGWDTSHRLGVQRSVTVHWRVSAWARHRNYSYDPDSPVRSVGLGQTFHHGRWEWQSDVALELDKEVWTGETGVFRRFGDTWRLGSQLGTEDVSQLSNEWYSEVSIRWSR